MLLSLRYRVLRSLFRLLLRCGVDERDLEAAVLRHQLKILRRGGTRPRFTDADRAFLAAAAGVLPRDRWKSFLVGPDTLIRWHRELWRRRCRRRSRRPGRPALDPSIKQLILRLGRENPRWGYLRIRSELLKLGIDVSATTIGTVLRHSGLVPLSDGSATAREAIDAAPYVPNLPNGGFSPSVGAFPRASSTPVPPRARTRARDGPAIAA